MSDRPAESVGPHGLFHQGVWGDGLLVSGHVPRKTLCITEAFFGAFFTI